MTRKKNALLHTLLVGMLIVFTVSGCGMLNEVAPTEILISKNREFRSSRIVIPDKKTIAKNETNKIQLRDSPAVRAALNYYTGKGKKFVSDGLVRREQYALMLEQELNALGLPAELSNIAFLESRFISDAKNPSGATGMWQFMPSTARAYGLSVGLFVDERKDPEKSTQAAARYLRELYDEHRDWYLAIASYNAGSGRIKGAIASCGSRDFFKFDSCSGLNKETLNFVYRFIALTLITRRVTYVGD